MPKSSSDNSSNNGSKPTVAERLERARAAAAPRLEQAAAQAAPKVEKAAQAAGSLLGTLRERAKETVKQFADGYGTATVDGAPAAPATDEPAARPRPRPRPGPRT